MSDNDNVDQAQMRRVAAALYVTSTKFVLPLSTENLDRLANEIDEKGNHKIWTRCQTLAVAALAVNVDAPRA